MDGDRLLYVDDFNILPGVAGTTMSPAAKRSAFLLNSKQTFNTVAMFQAINIYWHNTIIKNYAGKPAFTGTL